MLKKTKKAKKFSFKNLLSVRFLLSVCLFLSVVFAGYSMYHKVKHWGFSFSNKKIANVWTVEAHISFEPTGENIRVFMAIPTAGKEFKILAEDIIANEYKVTRAENGTNKIALYARPKEEIQNIYYRVMLYDNKYSKGKNHAPAPETPNQPVFDEQTMLNAREIIKIASRTEGGDEVQQIINTLNKTPADPAVLTFLPVKKKTNDLVEAIKSLLALKGIPSRVVRGVTLEENRQSLAPDLMIEAYTRGRWMMYDINTGKKGVPSSFAIFQRGGESLLDVEGGKNSSVRFSVIKSVNSSFAMASHRANSVSDSSWFEYSIYNLPLMEQNVLKWLMIFPLAILIVVLMRNVVGLKTMGTFTPMLLSMALVKTGFWQGLACFTVIVGLGLLIRAWLSRLNLLLVPRISSVVIFVILIMQILMITGYRFSIDIASSAVFFPIIIMAWIIERASITWEEDGPVNAGKEIFFSLIVAIVTYFVIVSEYIRHIMFAFNELNLVILFIVMLLGTYTGYRLTELKRFSPIVRKKVK